MNLEPFDLEHAKGSQQLRHDGVDPRTEHWATQVIGAAIEAHSILGPGYAESVYEKALSVELTTRDIPHKRQAAFRLDYKGILVGEGRIDILVDNTLVVELKAVEQIMQAHESQVVSYLKANRLKLGLLINFNQYRLRDGLKRIVH